ncbi:hypothetical protein TNCV_4496581 [Trichonephila clavipes]|nr:hypothetical protein TNCV_4496581 [Trichonephila clavipes]
MATGSYLTPIYSRSQSEVQGDLHKCSKPQDRNSFDRRTQHIATPLSNDLQRVIIEVTGVNDSELMRENTETRSTMEKEMLNSLMLLCTQNDITMDIYYNDVINDFAMMSDQKKPLLYQYNDSDSTKNKDV